MKTQLIHHKLDGFSYYNYALLHTRGYNHVFDMMRYDRAFLTRKSDLDDMLSASENYLVNGALKIRAILLCRYDWRGKTRPNWTHPRLLSNMEYEQIDDPTALYSLNSDFIELKPSRALNIKSEMNISAPLSDVLKVMYKNRAMPSEERDAHLIERAFSKDVTDQNITVTLTNFNSQEKDWNLNI